MATHPGVPSWSTETEKRSEWIAKWAKKGVPRSVIRAVFNYSNNQMAGAGTRADIVFSNYKHLSPTNKEIRSMLAEAGVSRATRDYALLQLVPASAAPEKRVKNARSQKKVKKAPKPPQKKKKATTASPTIEPEPTSAQIEAHENVKAESLDMNPIPALAANSDDVPDLLALWTEASKPEVTLPRKEVMQQEVMRERDDPAITILKITSEGCQWPMLSGKTTERKDVCGRPTRPGKKLCETHLTGIKRYVQL